MNNIRLDKENLRLSKNTKSVDALSIIRGFYDSEFLDQCINMLNNKKYEFMMRLKDQAKAKPPMGPFNSLLIGMAPITIQSYYVIMAKIQNDIQRIEMLMFMINNIKKIMYYNQRLCNEKFVNDFLFSESLKWSTNYVMQELKNINDGIEQLRINNRDTNFKTQIESINKVIDNHISQYEKALEDL